MSTSMYVGYGRLVACSTNAECTMLHAVYGVNVFLFLEVWNVCVYCDVCYVCIAVLCYAVQ
jgi:hypothetical protein